MKKVLLISLKKNHFPFSIAFLTPCLINNNIPYDVLDLQFEDDLEKRISSKEYFAVAVSAMSLDNYHVKKIFNRVMQIDPSLPRILGGRIHICPERLLKTIPFNYMIIEDADPTLPELLRAIISEKNHIHKVKGIAYWQDGHLIHSPARPSPPLINFFPNWNDFDFQAYLRLPMHPFFIYKGYPIVSSMGCVGNCTFCNPGYRNIRMRPVNDILIEMQSAVENYAVTSFNFVSEVFFLKEKDLHSFSIKYKESGLKLPWRCSIRPNFKPEHVKILADAGCNAVLIGMESYDNQVLKRINKNARTEMLDNLVPVLKSHNISVTCTVMAGNPGDTEKSITQSIDFCERHKVDPTLNVLQIYPGTAVYEEALNSGKIKNESIFFKLICNNKISPGHSLYPNMTSMSNETLCRVISQCRGRIERYLTKELPLIKNTVNGECRCVHCNQTIKTRMLKEDFTFTCHKCNGFGYVTQYLLFAVNDPLYPIWIKAMRKAERIIFCGNCRFINVFIEEMHKHGKDFFDIAVIEPRSVPKNLNKPIAFDTNFLNTVDGTEFDHIDVIFEKYYLGNISFIHFDEIKKTDTVILCGMQAPDRAIEYFNLIGVPFHQIINATPSDYKLKCEKYFTAGGRPITSNSIADLIWLGENLGNQLIAEHGKGLKLAIALTGKYGLFIAAGCQRTGIEIRILKNFCVTIDIEKTGYKTATMKDIALWHDKFIVVTPDIEKQEEIQRIFIDKTISSPNSIINFTDYLYKKLWPDMICP